MGLHPRCPVTALLPADQKRTIYAAVLDDEFNFSWRRMVLPTNPNFFLPEWVRHLRAAVPGRPGTDRGLSGDEQWYPLAMVENGRWQLQVRAIHLRKQGRRLGPEWDSLTLPTIVICQRMKRKRSMDRHAGRSWRHYSRRDMACLRSGPGEGLGLKKRVSMGG